MRGLLYRLRESVVSERGVVVRAAYPAGWCCSTCAEGRLSARRHLNDVMNSHLILSVLIVLIYVHLMNARVLHRTAA
jgi:hypothetical protein